MALEDTTYPIDELVYDLANLRAGHRFHSWAKTESRLAIICRQAYGFRDCPGYLRAGLPMEYGEGAVDFLRERHLFDQIEEAGEEDLGMGDIERLVIEWRSLLDLISHSPKLKSSRWQELQEVAKKVSGTKSSLEELPVLPEIPVRQRRRFQGSLKH